MTTDTTTKDVEIFYLKMHQAPNYGSTEHLKFSIERLSPPIDTKQYLELYKGVGDAFQWTDRLVLSDPQLESAINASKTHIYLLKHEGKTVGFSELTQEQDYIEVLYFGLLSTQIGQGYGPPFLKMMILEAWSKNPQWIQLNTCSLDHPKALSLYLKSGFMLSESKIKSSN